MPEAPSELDTKPPRPRVLSIGPADGAPRRSSCRRSGRQARDHPLPARRGRARAGDGRQDRPRPSARGARPAGLRRRRLGDVGRHGARAAGLRRARTSSWSRSRDARGQHRQLRPARPQRPPGRALRRGNLPGRGGITVRYLGVQPPVEPVAQAASRRRLRRRRPRRALRVVAAPRRRPRRPIRRGTRHARRSLRVRMPRGDSRRSTSFRWRRAPGARACRCRSACKPVGGTPPGRGVLVVLPMITWQGRNPVDDDGDGLPNVLDRGVAARLGRVLVGDGLPAGFAAHEAPRAHLPRPQRAPRTTSRPTSRSRAGGARGSRATGRAAAGRHALAAPRAGAAPAALRARGGTLVSLGTDSLRRQACGSRRDGRLVEPTRRRRNDLYGARLRPRRARATADLTIFERRHQPVRRDRGPVHRLRAPTRRPTAIGDAADVRRERGDAGGRAR